MWRNTLPPFWEGPALFPLPLPLVPARPPACCILGQVPPQRSRGAGRLSSSDRQRPPGIAFGTQPEHSKPPNHCDYKESC